MATIGERLLNEEVRHLSSCLRIMSTDLSLLQRFISQQFGSKYVSFCKDQKQDENRKNEVAHVVEPVPSTSKPSLSTSRDLRASPRIVLKRCSEKESQSSRGEAGNPKNGRMDVSRAAPAVEDPILEERSSSPVVFDALDSEFDDFEDEESVPVDVDDACSDEGDDGSDYDPLLDAYDDSNSNSAFPDVVIKSEVDVRDSDDEDDGEFTSSFMENDANSSQNAKPKFSAYASIQDDYVKPEILETDRGHPFLQYKNYTFHFSRVSKLKKMWKCSFTRKQKDGKRMKACYARIHTNHDLKNILVMDEIGEHTHPPTLNLINNKKIIQRLKEEAKSATHKKPCEIIKPILQSLSEAEKKGLPGYRSLVRVIQKYRSKLGILLPSPSKSKPPEEEVEEEEDDLFLRRRRNAVGRKSSAPPPLPADMIPIAEPVKVEVIKSARGFPMVIKDGFLYNYKKKGVSKLTWRCHRHKAEIRKQGKRICYAGLYTNEDLNDLCATAEGKHNHPPETKLCDYRRFTEKVKSVSLSSTRPATELATELYSELTEDQKQLYPNHQSIAHQITRRRSQQKKNGAMNEGDQQSECIDNQSQD